MKQFVTVQGGRNGCGAGTKSRTAQRYEGSAKPTTKDNDSQLRLGHDAIERQTMGSKPGTGHSGIRATIGGSTVTDI